MNETNLPEVEDRDWQQAEMQRDEERRQEEVKETFSRLFCKHRSGNDFGFDDFQDWELLASELGILKFYRSL